jgi:hypothetical protein
VFVVLLVMDQPPRALVRQTNLTRFSRAPGIITKKPLLAIVRAPWKIGYEEPGLATPEWTQQRLRNVERLCMMTRQAPRRDGVSSRKLCGQVVRA